jgi:hypothetical protein
MNPHASRALALVQSVYNGDPWHGPSIVATLRGVTAADALSHPVAGAHSIWELVRHVTAWTDEVAARLTGKSASDPGEGDWPEVGDSSDAGWKAALERLGASQGALAAVVASVPHDRWDRLVDDSRPADVASHSTCLQTLEGLAAHHAYHSGQIGVLKRAIERQRS